MKWMRERDLLIAQTMAFVQSVTGKKPEAEKTAVRSDVAATAEPLQSAEPASPAPYLLDIAALLAEPAAVTEPHRPPPLARADMRADFQSEISEIKARVANFRAHQERFNREREAYCSATMAKVHASLKDASVPPRLGK